MRTLAIAVIALALMAAPGTDEPTEGAMKAAFSARLAQDMRSALEFAAESFGPAALDRIRTAGADRFAIRSFVKLDCARLHDRAGHVCGFAVEIDTVAGARQYTLSGRYFPGRRALEFAHEA